jgi:hypothetical protein
MPSALDDLTASTVSKTTTLPSWFDEAQKSVVSGGTAAAANMPKIGDTTAGLAIDQLNDPNKNPFTAAQGSLNTIATGAANPWITDPVTGQVKPNTGTALGGLFSAQNDQLRSLIPQTVAPADAGAIAGGGFGSLRNVTAADTALTTAQADLFAKQMQAALTNQQTGVNAATGLSDSGAQGVKTETELGALEQADPMKASGALATLLSNVKAPGTVDETTHQSPLAILGALGKSYSENSDDIKNIFDKIYNSDIWNDIFGISPPP